jgi:hypothetical protein
MKTDGRTFAAFGGMSWPLPAPEASHRLRYALDLERTPEQLAALRVLRLDSRDLMTAATILDAYEQMIGDPESKRRTVVRQIRAAMTAGATGEESER